MVRFTISFHGRRWLPATNTLDILGLNFMGRAHEPRGDTTVVSKDGKSCLIDNRESGAPMCSKTQSSQTLDDQDESTDSEVPISITNKEKCYVAPLIPTGEDMIREAMAKYLNHIKGKGPHMIERGVPLMDNQLFLQEQKDQIRGNNAIDTTRKEVQ